MPCKFMSLGVEAVRQTAGTSSSILSLMPVDPLSIIVTAAAVSLGVMLFKAARRNISKSQVEWVRPTSALRAETRAQLEQAERARATLDNASAADGIKAATFEVLSRSPFVVEGAAVAAPLSALAAASTAEEARRAQQRLLRAVEASHNKVFVEAVKATATKAIRNIGFTTVRALPASSTKVRLVATNEGGRRLYAEMSTDPDGEPTVSAEVVNATHDESHAILDALELALKEEGIRASGAPIRKGSGGILPASAPHHHSHEHRHEHQHTQPRGSGAAGNATRRARRANLRHKQRQS